MRLALQWESGDQSESAAERGLLRSRPAHVVLIGTRMALNRVTEHQDRPLYPQRVAVQPVKRGTADVAGIKGGTRPAAE